MKGIVCEDAGRLVYREDLPEPVRGEGEAIVAIRRIGICGTDLHAYQGNQPYFTYPRILGHELSGVIEEIGDNPEGLRVGDQVSMIPYLHCGNCGACLSGKTNCCRSMRVLGVHLDGGMRERISVPVPHLFRMEGLSLDQAALLEPLAIGAHALRRSGLHPGVRALVIGAGPIGLGVMAMAAASGSEVAAMDVNADRLAFAKSWAKSVHTVLATENPKDRLLEWNDGELPSVVIDATGNLRSMTDAFGLVGHGGSLVYVGLVNGDITFNDPDFHARELTLLSSRNATREDFSRVADAVTSSKVDLNAYITHRCTLDRMTEQFDAWLKPETCVIKAIVEIN